MQNIIVMTAFVLLVFTSGILAGECEETVVIDSIEYRVPSVWCGQRLDSTQIADKSKLVRLPEEYCFEDFHIYLERQTRDALSSMAAAAAEDSIMIIVKSGYRSAGYQARLIKRRLADSNSFESIIRYVAPPGYSQHETGRAVDLTTTKQRFSTTATYRWLKEHAGAWGFVESYPNDTTSHITWEPWHWYYEGIADSE